MNNESQPQKEKQRRLGEIQDEGEEKDKRRNNIKKRMKQKERVSNLSCIGFRQL